MTNTLSSRAQRGTFLSWRLPDLSRPVLIAVTLLLAATSKRAAAITSIPPSSSRQFKNPEGAADGVTLLATLTDIGHGGSIDMIDGVGICLAAIKSLNTRLDVLDCGFPPAAL